MSSTTLKNNRYILPLIVLLMTTSCTGFNNPIDDYEELKPVTIMDAPAPNIEQSAIYDVTQVERGKYLVELLGCGSCHTEGALVGEPDFSKSLAGSHIGIAYSNPLKQSKPGVIYPSNLTPDLETGIGSWSDNQIIDVIRFGIDKHGRQQLSVMPWPAYAKLTGEDAYAIVTYLRSLSPIQHRVPDNVSPGQKATGPYVHFGVYQRRH